MPEHTPPPVTVLMPVYNGSQYLTDAIESILTQSFDNFEFLIIDDASEDDSRDIVRSYGDPRMKLIENHSNLGQTRTLNGGIDIARGKYIARLDQDDIALPRRLEKQIAFLDSNPDVALLGTGVQVIDENGYPMYRVLFPTKHREIINDFPLRNPFAHSSVMCRVDALKDAGGYDTDFSYAQDMALWLQISKEKKLANLRDILVKIRFHSGQTTLGFRKAKRLSEELSLIEHIISLPGLVENSKQAGMFFRAYILFKLGYKRRAISSLLDTLRKKPIGLLFNNYIWKGIMMKIMYHIKQLQYSTNKSLTPLN